MVEWIERLLLEAVDSSLIPGRVKTKAIKIGI